jgi:hypothetical protein
VIWGALCWLTSFSAPPGSTSQAATGAQHLAIWRSRAVLGALAAAAFVVLVTPPLWTTNRLKWLPWPLESYLNGVHVYGRPQSWLFPIFPWVAFAFAGLAVGFVLVSDHAKRNEVSTFVALGGAGAVTCVLALLLDASPVRLYDPGIYDYWHTSPNFFLMRCGILLMILFLVYAWCR